MHTYYQHRALLHKLAATIPAALTLGIADYNVFQRDALDTQHPHFH
jgi:hypothetical protein